MASKITDDCSGVAGRTSKCNEKAEMARDCPDLTQNFDQCWAAIQAIVYDFFIETPSLNVSGR